MSQQTSETNDKPSFTPFDGIGLCFSGGGYRATFFALGAISYLNRIQYQGSSLLSRTLAVSSVSGGTLLAVAYTKAAQSDNFDFTVFYKEFYQQFIPENDRLLKDAVAKLKKKKTWIQHPHKKRSIINAFALTYGKMPIFDGRFDVYKDPSGKGPSQVCFNSTEFSFGLPFRFQNQGNFGNGPLNDNKPRGRKELNQLKHEVQLGDIVASSSCFPLGFEPMIFPDDYISNQSSKVYKDLKKDNYFDEGIGVMDGGIADNQGIESMIKITERSAMKGKINLIMVNDVASYRMDPWKQDMATPKGKMSLGSMLEKILGFLKVKPIYWITLLMGILILAFNGLQVFGNSISWLYVLGGILTGTGLVLSILGMLLAGYKDKGVEWLNGIVKENVPEALLNDVISFQTLEVGLLRRMLTERITSGTKMISEVFLKQIRRLNYDRLYEDSLFDNKRVTATVYQLNGVESVYTNNKFNKKIEPKPSKSLTKTALIASQTLTSLWWDEKDIELNRMDTLIACGQFTACYNLLDYVLKLKDNGYTSEGLTILENHLKADWKAFNKTPMALVKPGVVDFPSTN